MNKSILRLLSYSLVFLFPGIVNAQPETDLSTDPQWRALLHYQQGWGSVEGASSLVADPGFFLSESGKQDAQAELAATLEAFQQPIADPNEHPLCRFPARARWLRSKLGDTRVPVIPCERFTTWYQAIDPRGATLIFASAFLNNPASSFGHTLVRIDSMAPAYLSYVANFAANATDNNAVLYAWKGLFGGYGGYFSIAPYFERIKKYSDLEYRDMWEYKLSLTQDEVSLMTSHLWELKDRPFVYYYFDENCSQQLLALLDVARPSLNLREKMKTWVIPVDTVRVAVESGIVADVAFRPSLTGRLSQKLRSLKPEQVQQVRSLSEPHETVPNLTSVHVADAALEYLAYRRSKAKGEQEKELNDYSRRLMLARSRLPPMVEEEVSTPPRPEISHHTGRLSLSAGRVESKKQLGVELRPAFHNLLDPREGYVLGSGIEFLKLSTAVREGEGLLVDKLTLIDLTSLTPRSELYHPIAWRFSTGLERRTYERDQSRHVGGYLAGGAGRAWQLNTDSLLAALVHTKLVQSPGTSRDVAFQVGPRLTLSLSLSDRLRVLGESWIAVSNGFDSATAGEHSLQLSYSVTRDVALRLSAGGARRDGAWQGEYLGAVDYYFNP